MADINVILYKVINNDKSIIWKSKYNNLECVAGMLACSLALCSQINNTINNSVYYYMDCDVNLDDFLLLSNVNERRINSYMRGKISGKKYFIWVPSYDSFSYNLFTFNSAYFIQGIISICSSFSKDFRDYIYKKPFDKNKQDVIIEDYDPVIEYNIVDTFDVTDDEDDEDENIINPYHNYDYD